MAITIETDALIIGGGIAGLWLLNRLRADGYNAMLMEHDALGSGQSIASQGMIHGGLKYALGGALTSASNAIADMPGHWRACLEGRGDVDLRGTRVLSREYYMWPRDSVRSRLTAFVGSKTLNARIRTVAPEDYPPFFRGHIRGPLYQLNDLVLDVPSLLERLGEAARKHIFRIDWSRSRFRIDDSGAIAALEIDTEKGTFRISARRYLFSSGEGIPDLLRDVLGKDAPPALQTQLRPLHMVMVKHDYRDPVYVHCIANRLTTTPEVTITTHPAGDGGQVWYLGGELAESGTHRSAEQQIDTARTKLEELFPWCDFSRARWQSFRINRAEPRQDDGRRPEDAGIAAHRNLILCWPSKLSLAPNLGRAVIKHFLKQNIRPGSYRNPDLPLPFPGIAVTPWSAM